MKAEENSSAENVVSASGNLTTISNSSSSGAWGESKLSDVVKGVAKPKSGNGHGPKHLLNGPALVPSSGNSSAVSTVAAASKATSVESQISPLPNGDLAQSTLALTPPTSPGKKEKPFTTSTTSSKPAKASQQSAAAPPPTSSDAASSSSTSSSKAVASSGPPPGVSYAKMAEQNKDRLEQMAREVKERELEQERERRRVAQSSMCFNSNYFNVFKIKLLI